MNRTNLHSGLMIIVAWLGAVGFPFAASAEEEPSSERFVKEVVPFLAKYCFDCHGRGKSKGAVTLDKDRDGKELPRDRELWENLAELVRTGRMPPKDKANQRPRPDPAEADAAMKAVETILAKFDCTGTQQTGRVTIRLVLSGLTCEKARANGDGGGDHARASSAFLTGCQAWKTAGANFRAGTSADQVAAKRIGDQARLPSLELGIERYRGSGNCDSSHSCVYEHTIAWRSSSPPLPNEVAPRLIFDRLFSERPNDPDRLKRNRIRTSVLDAVLDDAKGLENKLGGSDRRKLDQYLSCVRELELRIARAETLPPVQPPEEATRPSGMPAELAEHIRLICDLMVLAFQTDVTRVITCMFAREWSEQKYRMIGVNEGHHELTHHRNDPEKISKVARINNYHMQQFAYLVGKLKWVLEGDGTLLDNCMIAYGSGNSDGNRHTHEDLPILVAGKGGGSIQSGRHPQYPTETPVNNLWLAMLDRMGVPTSSLGDSTGVLSGLS